MSRVAAGPLIGQVAIVDGGLEGRRVLCSTVLDRPANA
jgi:hypothetical protein